MLLLIHMSIHTFEKSHILSYNTHASVVDNQRDTALSKASLCCGFNLVATSDHKWSSISKWKKLKRSTVHFKLWLTLKNIIFVVLHCAGHMWPQVNCWKGIQRRGLLWGKVSVACCKSMVWRYAKELRSMQQELFALGTRVFVCPSVHEKGPVLFSFEWCPYILFIERGCIRIRRKSPFWYSEG